MKYLLPLILLVAGCSSVPIAELENQYFQCTAAGAQGCNLIAEEMDRRYQLQENREKRNASKCNQANVTCLSGAEFRAMMARSRY